MRKTVGMLLAGGVGSRLSILAKKRAKPAVPFGGMYRIIDFTLSNACNSGVRVLGILTQYKPLSLMDHIGSGSAWDYVGRSRVAKILPPRTGEKEFDWYKGTADAIYQNIGFIRDFAPERVLILSGDHIYKMDYSELVNYHKEKGADLTIATMEVPLSEAPRFGIAITDTDGRIVDWEEKPKTPKSNIASMGIYVFNMDVLENVLKKKLGNDFGKDIIGWMIKNYKVYAYPFKGYWRDVGTIQSYWEANMDALDENSQLTLDEWNLRTNLAEMRRSDRAPAYVGSGGTVLNSIVSPGCRIEGKVVHSVLSPGVIVKKGAFVHDSVIMQDCVIGENAVLETVILDKNVVVGAETHIGAGHESVPNKKYPEYLNSGITVIGKNAVVPEKMEIGKNVLIFPDVRKEDYSGKKLECGETIEI
ncbi:MAG: glucose-1-phosphate adenylyltransferase [Thermoplasmata archaeon]